MSPDHVADLVKLRLTDPDAYVLIETAETWEETRDFPVIPSDSVIETMWMWGWDLTFKEDEEIMILLFAAWSHADGVAAGKTL